MGINMGSPCNNCDKHSTCRSLCPEAEAFVNKDYVSQGEVLVDMDGMLSSTNKDYKGVLHTMMRRIERANIKHRDKAILALYIAHIPAEKIAEYMGCSAPNVWRVIRKYTT